MADYRLKNLDSKWIWNDHWNAEDKNQARVVLFRREIEITKPIESFVIQISADTKYKLHVNGDFVEYGPSRGDKQIWFYDTVSLKEHIRPGKNCIGVMVLRYPENQFKGNYGMIRTSTPGVYIDGMIRYKDGEEEAFCTDRQWKSKKDDRISFIREDERYSPLMIHERFYGDPIYRSWKLPGYDDRFWDGIFCYKKSQVLECSSPGNLRERTIPFMYRKKRKFNDMMQIRMSMYGYGEWKNFLEGNQKLVIPPNTRELVEIDAGEEMTGFFHIAFEKGMGAKARILYSEAYVQNGFEGPENIPIKGDRCDKKNGHLNGYEDNYYLYGEGNEQRAENYYPYWFRTFRFIQLEIITGDEPLILAEIDYEETGYPLEVQSHVEVSDTSLEKVWEISERTLRRCMHETYEDCPFYEQLQYVRDTRQQILYTYAISADDRLARRCIEDMKRAQRYDGLLNCNYPSCDINVIPTFSLDYIFMVHDHMMYFGDKILVREALPTIENILNFFRRHLTEEGYVEKIGGVLEQAAFWSYVDWASEWNDNRGVPLATHEGPLTMESLLYIMGLQKAADLYEYMGRKEEACFCREEAKQVQQAVLKACTGKDGMLMDGPGVEMYSQHCQVFAALTHTGEEEQLKINLFNTVIDKTYPQCTVAMSFYLFRALEEMDLYEYTQKYWERWHTMIRNHCTTCVESEAYARSECHGWGALILYELPTISLGVRPAAPGYEKIKISPVPGYFTSAKGQVITPKGMVTVSWKLEDGECKVSWEAPEGVEVIKE